MMKWVLLLAVVLLCLLALLLLLPVRYEAVFEKWKLSLQVELLFGLWKKELVFPGGEEPPDASGQLPAGEEENIEDMASMLEEAEQSAGEVPAEEEPPSASPLPAEREEPDAREAEQRRTSSQEPEATAGQDTVEIEESPSLLSQVRFAIENGLAGRVFHGAWKLFCHSFPRKWEVTGAFGTGDPMDTAMVQGLFCAFLPGVADGVMWNYVEKEDGLKGKASGRIIPLYVLYVALGILVSKEMREFWKYRKAAHSV